MDEKEFDYINVIPFIDIMLVLLTIVLTTSTFIARGAIPLALPRAASHEHGSLKTISIEIDRGSTVYLNAAPMSLVRFAEKIRTFSPETPILIQADKAIALQLFVDVLDVVKQAGFKRISLQTEEKK